MNDTQKSALALLRSSLWGEPLPEAQPGPEVFNELISHAVLGLTGALSPSFLDSLPNSKALKRGIMSCVLSGLRVRAEETEAFRLLEAEEIPAAVLKGSAAAMSYPYPQYRTVGDIDLITAPRFYDRACEALTRGGFVRDPELPDVRHTVFRRNGVTLELHRFFSAQGGGAALDGMIFEGLFRSQKQTLGPGSSFVTLPPLENGLVLLRHVRQHLNAGIGLRQIIDFIMYIHRYLNDSLWNDGFGKAAADLGLDKLAVTLAGIGVLYLGLPDREAWFEQYDPDLCEDLTEIILNKGNFGRKNADNRFRTVLNNSAESGFHRYFKRAGLVNFPFFREHPRLAFFAPVCQLFRYAVKSAAFRHPVTTLIRNARASAKEHRVYQRLGIQGGGK